jgi:hypothetical protein
MTAQKESQAHQAGQNALQRMSAEGLQQTLKPSKNLWPKNSEASMLPKLTLIALFKQANN